MAAPVRGAPEVCCGRQVVTAIGHVVEIYSALLHYRHIPVVCTFAHHKWADLSSTTPREGIIVQYLSRSDRRAGVHHGSFRPDGGKHPCHSKFQHMSAQFVTFECFRILTAQLLHVRACLRALDRQVAYPYLPIIQACVFK